MAGFVRAATVMHNSAQSGSSSSSLLLDPLWTDLTKVGLGQLGSLPLCAVNLGGIWLISTQRATGPAQTGSLRCQGEDYIQNR